MTKRALIVIAVLILLPLVVILIGLAVNAAKNPVVAEYGGRIDVIEYKGMTLHAIPGEDEYSFRFGEYLGKVGNSRYGASFYRVRDDSTGRYFAISDGEKNILYTETGKLIDGVYDFVTPVTRVIVDNYSAVVEDSIKVAAFADIEHNEKKEYELKPAAHVLKNGTSACEFYDLRVCYGGSAISTEKFGQLCYLKDEKMWVYLSEETIKNAKENKSSTGIVYQGTEVSDPVTSSLFSELLRAGIPDETKEESAADSTEFIPYMFETLPTADTVPSGDMTDAF
ncbi:MAG: hypothetical protein MJ102_01170 [Clostridia bacterium]|nr:hypothetical protein [Clostridia bacterium]